MIKFKAILARPLDFDELIGRLMNDIDVEVELIDQEYQKTYDTWEHKPDFEIEYAEIAGNKIVGSTAIYTEASSDNPYPFIEKGTKVRYATMTPDFKAKTVPRVVSSGPGRGGLLYVSKRRPRPGIKARKFTEEIQKKEQPRFEKLVKQTFDDFSKRQ